MGQARERATNRLLAYPGDARLLLANADDVGMYGAINQAVVRAFREGIVRSTSLMVPCPGASQAMGLLRENPDIGFRVHLSVVRDIDGYRWGPLTPQQEVPSRLDADGSLYGRGRMPELLERANLADPLPPAFLPKSPGRRR